MTSRNILIAGLLLVGGVVPGWAACTDGGGYPWATGDCLYVEDLNAAISDAGNVKGPTVSVVNEIASWSATDGKTLRQGAARITDNKTGAIIYDTGEGATIGATTNPNFTAKQIADWVFCAVGCNIGVSYDAVRGVGVLTPSSTIDLVNGTAGYVVAQVPISGAFPTAVGMMGMGIVDVDGGSVWGANTAVSDNRGQVATTHAARFMTAAEWNMNFTSPNSAGIGMVVQSAAMVQPSYSVGISCGPLDLGNYTNNNPIVAKWSHCLDTIDGSSDVGVSIGRTTLPDAVNANSQLLILGYNDAVGTRLNIQIHAQGGNTKGELRFANMDGENTTLNGVNLVVPSSLNKPAAITIGTWNGGATAGGSPVTGLTASLDSLTQIFQYTDATGTSAAVFVKAKGGTRSLLEISGTAASYLSVGAIISTAMPTSCTGQLAGTLWKNGSAVNVC